LSCLVLKFAFKFKLFDNNFCYFGRFNFCKGKVEHEGGEEERGRGVAKRADKGAAKESKKPPQKRNQENEELCRDYEKWEMRNNNTISKIIANTFPKYFLFFAL